MHLHAHTDNNYINNRYHSDHDSSLTRGASLLLRLLLQLPLPPFLVGLCSCHSVQVCVLCVLSSCTHRAASNFRTGSISRTLSSYASLRAAYHTSVRYLSDPAARQRTRTCRANLDNLSTILNCDTIGISAPRS